MKMLKCLSFFAAIVLISTACTSSTKESDESASEADQVCTYKYDSKSLDFKWTAYKFTEKTGVPGTFNEINVTAAEDATSIEDLLQSVEFTINTGSVNSNEVTRDAKIAQFFFGTMSKTETIIGKIVKVDGANATINLTINEFVLDLPGTIKVVGDTINLNAIVDFNEFGGEEAIAMLNQVCSEKHTGEDGKSVFWDVVDINIKALYTKSCN